MEYYSESTADYEPCQLYSPQQTLSCNGFTEEDFMHVPLKHFARCMDTYPRSRTLWYPPTQIRSPFCPPAFDFQRQPMLNAYDFSYAQTSYYPEHLYFNPFVFEQSQIEAINHTLQFNPILVEQTKNDIIDSSIVPHLRYPPLHNDKVEIPATALAPSLLRVCNSQDNNAPPTKLTMRVKKQIVIAAQSKKRHATVVSVRRTGVKQQKTMLRRSLVARVSCALIRHILGHYSEFKQPSLEISRQLADVFTKYSQTNKENSCDNSGVHFQDISSGLVPLTDFLLEAIAKYKHVHRIYDIPHFKAIEDILAELVSRLNYSAEKERTKFMQSQSLCIDVQKCFYNFVVGLMASLHFNLEDGCILDNCSRLLIVLSVDVCNDDATLFADLHQEHAVRFINKHKIGQ